MLAWSKLNSIEALISHTLINSEISHDGFTIEDIRMIKSQRANYNVKNTDYNAKIFEIENKILSITELAPTSALTSKMLDIKSKYFTTGDYNEFTSQTVDAEVKQER